jgi:hypothetical protein
MKFRNEKKFPYGIPVFFGPFEAVLITQLSNALELV